MQVERAPSRVCLFGEHQDYLGLPVIAQAIDLYFEIEATPRNDTIFHIEKPDIGEVEEFDPTKPIKYTKRRDYLKAAVKVLKRDLTVKFDKGYNFVLHSDIPIGAGCGSSSAMLVAWIRLLLKLTDSPFKELPYHIARLAYKAEVIEFREPGGMMDHYTAAMGGLLFLDFRHYPVKTERLPKPVDGIVLVDTSERKDTLKVLRELRAMTERGVKLLKKIDPKFNLQETARDEIEPQLERLPKRVGNVIRLQLCNRDITLKAYEMLKSGSWKPTELGGLLTQHHHNLRNMGVSTRTIDELIELALSHGALGGKLNGSGGGGTFFIYAPGKEEEIAELMREKGVSPYIVNPAVD